MGADNDAMFGDCKPVLKGAAFVTLCLIDLCHVFLTMLNMGFLAYLDKADVPAGYGSRGRADQPERKP